MSLSPVNNACYAVLNKPVPPPKNNPGKASGSPIVAAALSLFGCSFFVPNRPASADAGPNDALQDTGDAATDCLCSDVIQSDINQTDVLPDGIIPDAIQSDADSDGQVCTPQSYTDNTFSNALASTISNVIVGPGNISLAEDYSKWTDKYEGDVNPTAVGWSDFDPLAWTAPTPEIQSGILHLNTVDSDRYGYYSKNQSLLNATGWLCETKMKVGDNTQSNPSSDGCAIEIGDDVKKFELRFLNTNILDFTSGLNYVMDTRSAFHTYRLVGRSDNIFVYVDGVLRINGVNAMTSATAGNAVKFHDLTTTADSEAFWDYVYCYNGGTALPFSPSGSVVLGMIDTGTTNNNIGSGATIKWTENLPTGTSVALEIFASNNPTLPGASCASGLSNNILGETIPNTCAGQYVWWKPNIYSANPYDKTPTISDVTLDYQTCN